MNAVAKIKPKLNVIGVVPATENLPGGNAQRPGDIVTAYNGKKVEILNTDAEGRLILGDALSYTIEKYNPVAVVDLATLTGACGCLGTSCHRCFEQPFRIHGTYQAGR